MGRRGFGNATVFRNRHPERVFRAGDFTESLARVLASCFYYVIADCLDSVLSIAWLNGMVEFKRGGATHCFFWIAATVTDFELLAAAKRGEGWLCLALRLFCGTEKEMG